MSSLFYISSPVTANYCKVKYFLRYINYIRNTTIEHAYKQNSHYFCQRL